MTAKQNLGNLAPDGSTYVVLTDGAGSLGTTITAVSSDNLAQVGGTTVSTGNGVVGAGVQRVSIASDNTAFSTNAVQSGTWTVQPGNTANTIAWKTVEQRATTGTKANVASSATSVTVLASNANRLKMAVYNDSTAILYLDLTGGTASSSSYSLQLAPNAWYISDYPCYTGAITGIWASANGNARVTEWT